MCVGINPSFIIYIVQIFIFDRIINLSYSLIRNNYLLKVAIESIEIVEQNLEDLVLVIKATENSFVRTLTI